MHALCCCDAAGAAVKLRCLTAKSNAQMLLEFARCPHDVQLAGVPAVGGIVL